MKQLTIAATMLAVALCSQHAKAEEMLRTYYGDWCLNHDFDKSETAKLYKQWNFCSNADTWLHLDRKGYNDEVTFCRFVQLKPLDDATYLTANCTGGKKERLLFRMIGQKEAQLLVITIEAP